MANFQETNWLSGKSCLLEHSKAKGKKKNNQSDNRKINEFVIKDVLWK